MTVKKHQHFKQLFSGGFSREYSICRIHRDKKGQMWVTGHDIEAEKWVNDMAGPAHLTVTSQVFFESLKEGSFILTE